MTTHAHRLRLGLLAAGLLSAGSGALAAPAVAVTDNGQKRHDLPNHIKQDVHEIAIRCDEFHCNLQIVNHHYLDATGSVQRVEGTVGVHFWPGDGQGWYPSDAFRLFLDGAPLALNGTFCNTRVLAQGQSALIETTLTHAKAAVRIRFAYKPGQQGLDVQVLLPPTAEGQPAPLLSANLTCYPAFFTAWNKRRGDRWVLTPTRSIQEVREPGLDMNARAWPSNERKENLALPAEGWLYYYDRFFNSPDGNGKGSCGLVFQPERLEQATVNVTDYPIVTTLKAKPGERSLLFTLWQTPARDYEPLLKGFPLIAADSGQRLRDGALFLPGSLVAFDRAAEERSLAELVAVVGKHDALTAELAALAGAIDRLKASPGTQDEEQVARQLVGYRRAFWKAARALPRPRQILALQGAHYPEWKLAEAVAVARDGLRIEESFFSTSWRGDRLTRFPATEIDMLRYDAIVFNNVSVVPLRESGQALLKQFVANGGGLVVFGGFYSYVEGMFPDSVLEEMLPVTMAGPYDVKKLPAAAAILPGEKVDGLPPSPFGENDVILWLQSLAPKPDSAVALYAGLGRGRQAPFLVLGRYGEGRVAAFAGTVYGVPPAGKTEFWQNPDWPAFLAGVIRWTCGN